MMEKDIEKKLTDEVRKMGGRSYKFVSPGNVGVPDRIIILPKVGVVFVELKTDTGRLRPTQKVQISRMRNLGCEVRVLKGLSDVEYFLDEMRERINDG